MKDLLKGKICVVRSNMAGVFFGEVVEIEGSQVLIKNARKIWRWNGANTVEDISQTGVLSSSKVTVMVETVLIEKFEQIIPCTEFAITNLTNQEVWKA